MILRLSLLDFCRISASSLSAVAFITCSASAQEVSFQIDNFFSLEQIVAQEAYDASSQSAPIDEMTLSGGSSSAITQEGTSNFAQSFVARSSDALTGIAQSGNSNASTAVILDSPDSAIAQLQVGDSNISVVGIIGGSENGVSTLQLGNNLGVSVALVNSTGTKVVYGQAGRDYNGGVVIRNAPVGTVIKLN